MPNFTALLQSHGTSFRDLSCNGEGPFTFCVRGAQPCALAEHIADDVRAMAVAHSDASPETF